jgi:STE24 endopeptidase
MLYVVDRGSVRAWGTVAAAVAAAEAAVLLLRPRDGVMAPAPVDAGSYFTVAELDRARRFRRPQLALHAASAAIDAALLARLAARPPRRLARPPRRPVLAAAGAGAALSLALDVAPLPLGAAAHRRAVAVGLSTQGWGAWAGDRAKAGALGGALAGAGAGAAVALMRRFPRRWWLPGSGALVAFGALSAFAGPVVLDPIFNRFAPLAPGPARDDVLALARAAGVRVGEVYEVDASRRTTAANAYVTGLGATKRVVLYDTLLRHFDRDEVRLVVAHELGHVRHRDVLRSLAHLALTAPAGLLAVATLTRRLSPASAPPGPATLPALALSSGLVGALLGPVSAQLSRRVEARTDLFALTLTDAPAPFVSFQRGIALRNLGDPDPPRWLTRLLATHPPTVERIGLAEAFSLRSPARREGRRTREGS